MPRILLNSKQAVIRQAMTKFRVMVGATGTGKTWYGPIWAWDQIREVPRSSVLVVGRNYGHHVKELLMPYVIEWLQAVGEPYKPNYSTFTIRLLRNGSIFRFGSDDARDAMEGFHITAGAWIDEAGLMHPKTWEIVKRRVSLSNMPVLVTTIPYQAGWVKKELFERWRGGDRDITYTHLTWRDNRQSAWNPKGFTDEEIIRQKRTLPAHEFSRKYEGEWSKPFGMIFPEPDDIELLADEWPVPDDWPMRQVSPGLEVPDGWPMFGAHDFGFGVPTASLWGVLSPEDVLYIVACREKAGWTMEQHVDEWKDYGLHRTLCSWGDPANPEEWQTASDHGYPVTTSTTQGPALNKVLYGIGATTDRLQTGRLKIIQGAHAELWLRRREGYLWAPDPKTLGESLLEVPAPGEAEHLMDATRYLCVGLKSYSVAPNESLVLTGRATITSRGVTRATR